VPSGFATRSGAAVRTRGLATRARDPKIRRAQVPIPGPVSVVVGVTSRSRTA